MWTSTSKQPVIAGIEITTDDQGRFSLNALHRASGGKKTKQPSDWLKLKGTEELIAELDNSEDPRSYQNKSIVSKSGRYGGTFAHEILAVEYAGWVSPAFRIQVNQAFIDSRTVKVDRSQAAPLPLAVDIAKSNKTKYG
ncbi:KilA-N domain-containing protein [Shimia sp. R11_0]|uniref:KilA-N domain-containing protein n=1 Tax=Shimia sp. R11_0 TaxID=2821096 RepID=UPI001ADA9EE1|nr:KilA-N domain-containing protein [Shimia sp. R11_0]MBO9477560.1 KilA-N domain-containing protein [Shimia sp. R11_0]